MSPIPRMSRRRAAIVAFISTLVLALPVGVIASHQFSDVPNDHPFHNDIDAIADAGVTGGCATGKYCPSSFVTRGQMAAFMNRLGALGPGKTPVVDAAELDGIDSTGFLQTGTIVTSIDGSAWRNHVLGSAVADQFVTQVRFAGDGVAALALVAPSIVGQTTYGLAALQVCIVSPSGGGFISRLEVFRTNTDGSSTLVFADDTDRSAAGCYSVAPNVAVGEGLGIAVDLGGGATARIGLGSVETTWSSVGTFSVLEVAPADPAVVGPSDD